MMKPIVNKTVTILILSCATFLSSSLTSAQKQEGIQKLKHEVTVTLKLVQVYVTDKKGNPVSDLGKEDFGVFDNGKEKRITEFEKRLQEFPSKKMRIQPHKIQETTHSTPGELLSRKFFLFFDFAYNNARGILQAKKAVSHFIKTQLQPSDEVGLISYSAIRGLTLHEYLTTDHAKVQKVTDSFGVKEMHGRAETLEEEYWRYVTGENPLDAGKQGGVGRVEPEPDRLWLGGENLSPEIKKFQAQQDGNIHAIHFIQKMKDFALAMRYIPGYKHIILFSSGVPYSLMYGMHQTPDVSKALRDRWDTGNKLLQLQFEDMINEVAASNCSIYSMDTEDMGTVISVNSRVRGGYTLQTLASSTGGKYFGDMNSLEEHLETIQSMTGSYYVIGYSIDEKWDGKYHKIKVHVYRPGCEVHAQRGYFNPKPFAEYSKLEKTLHLVDLALNERPLFQTPGTFPLVAVPCVIRGKPNLALFSKINKEQVPDLSDKDVEIVSIVFDKKDEIVQIERNEIDFSKLSMGNIYFSTLLALEPGEYKSRIVIRNLETGRSAVASAPVEALKSPAPGLQLTPPLLLEPMNNAFFLKKPSPAYFFDLNQYSPLMGSLGQGTDRIFAAIRCSFSGIQRPDILFTVNLIHHKDDLRKTVPVTVSILNKHQEEDTVVFLLECETEKLQSGDYFLYLSAKDTLSQSGSRVNATFKVK